MKSERFIMPALLETVKQKVLTNKAKETVVTVTRLGEDATILGAVALLLIEIFDPPIQID